MKKAIVVLMTVFLVALFAGCSGGSPSAASSTSKGEAPGKEIRGDCTSVVEQCQGVTADEDVTVVVVGRAEKTPKGDNVYCVRDDSDGISNLVFVTLKNAEDGAKISGRTTFKGKLDTRTIDKYTIFLDDVEIV